MKKIAVLGSTGSIGTQTLEVIRANPGMKVEALAARSSIGLLEKQIREFCPKIAGVYDEEKAKELAARVSDTGTKIIGGMKGIVEAATASRADIVVTGIVGMIGIEPTVAAIDAGKTIALANKETLVCAGHLIMPFAKKKGVRILPVDSEHSAIFQCLRGNRKNPIRKILLTASGGPFRNYSAEELRHVTLKDALKHPTWSMGKKVTIDSSTMVNKGLEVIEAHWLFGVPVDRIQVVIQPQSIIHSAVEYADGAVIAQLGTPDMKLPISYALTCPRRVPVPNGKSLDFTSMTGIEIAVPDTERFPGLKLAFHAGEVGGSLPTVFNAANEIAVRAFLDGKIRWIEIPELISDAMEAHEAAGVLDFPDIEEIHAVQRETEERLRADRNL